MNVEEIREALAEWNLDGDLNSSLMAITTIVDARRNQAASQGEDET